MTFSLSHDNPPNIVTRNGVAAWRARGRAYSVTYPIAKDGTYRAVYAPDGADNVSLLVEGQEGIEIIETKLNRAEVEALHEELGDGGELAIG